MSDRRTMTLNLTEEEMGVLSQLAERKDLSKTAVLRQALRLYQLLDARVELGDKLRLENEQTKYSTELMIL